MTVKELKQALNGIADSITVMDIQLNEIVFIDHNSENDILLCKDNPIGRCNRTGKHVYPSEVREYSAYCPELDEDLYEFEYEQDLKTLKLWKYL